jgi:hypothetical protein
LKAVIYNADGYILREYNGPETHVDIQVGKGELLLKHVSGNSSTDYVDLDSLVIKPKKDYDIDALPLPCNISIEGEIYHCTEQPEFEFDAPGMYTIEVDAGPQYLRKTFHVDYQP